MFKKDHYKKRIESSENRVSILSAIEEEVKQIDISQDQKKEIQKEIIVYKNTCNCNEQDFNAGIITPEYRDRIKNRITLALLSLIDKINEANKEDSDPKNEFRNHEEQDFLNYCINWKETMDWFHSNKKLIASEIINYTPTSNAKEIAALSSELKVFVDYLDLYWEQQIKIPLKEWIINQLNEDKFQTTNLDLLEFGISNLLETPRGKKLNDFSREHIYAHLDVCVSALRTYFDSRETL